MGTEEMDEIVLSERERGEEGGGGRFGSKFYEAR